MRCAAGTPHQPPGETLKRLFVALATTVLMIAAVATTPAVDAAAAQGICTLTRVGDDVQLEFDGTTSTPNIRRNGSWLVTLAKGTDTYTDVDAPADSTYVVRTRPGGLLVETPCTEVLAGAIERVIHLSIDGLRPDYVNPELMPRLSQLAATGASTMNARSDPSQTRTLPNHVSQFTGRFVWGVGGHRTTFNEDPGNTIHARAGSYVPSVFDVVDDNGGTTIVYAGKEKFDYIGRSYAEKLDVYVRTSPEAAVSPFLEDVVAATGPTYAFFHIRNPDIAGHLDGWGSTMYEDAVTSSDVLVGQLLDGLEAAGLRSTTTIIVTADHGGPIDGIDHSGVGNAQNFTIPFVVGWAGTSGGDDLYALNADGGVYADPGFLRINRDGPQPIRGHDAANLSLDLLELPALDAPAVNAAHSLITD